MHQIVISLEDQQELALLQQATKHKRTLSEEIQMMIDTYCISEEDWEGLDNQSLEVEKVLQFALAKKTSKPKALA